MIAIHFTLGGAPMGDKNPKSKDKNKKQDNATKDQKKKDNVIKQTPANAGPGKKGK